MGFRVSILQIALPRLAIQLHYLRLVLEYVSVDQFPTRGKLLA